MLAKYPLTLAVSGLIAGILAYEHAFRPHVWQSFFILLLCLCCALLCILKRKGHFYSNIFFLAIITVPSGIFICAAHDVYPANHLKNLPSTEIPVVITGEITEPPVIYPSLQNGHFVMNVREIKTGGRCFAARGLVRVNFYSFVPDICETDTLTLTGMLKPLRKPSNPGQFDYAKFLQRQGIFRTVSVSSRANIIKTYAEDSIRARLFRIRTGLSEKINRLFPEATAEVVSSLVLGAKNKLDNEFSDALIKTGTVHFFAVSGLHLALLVGAAWSVLLRIQLRDRFISKVLIAIIILYVLLVGFQAPLVRSAIMVLTYMCADFAARKKNALNSISLAAIIILLFNPNELFSIGFQLSFIAVLSIILFEPAVERIIFGPVKDGDSWLAEKKWHAKTIDNCMTAVRKAFATSSAAYIGTVPIVLWHFHIITPLVLLINVMLAPLITFLLIAGLACLPLLSLPVFLWYPLHAAVQFLSNLLIFIVEKCAGFRFSYFYMPDMHMWCPPVYYAAAIALYIFYKHGENGREKTGVWRSYAAALSMFFVIAILYFTGFTGKLYENRFAVLDVSKGCASCVFFRNGSVLVYDTGTDGNFDVGRNVMAPYLWKNGHREIDVLVLSHPDKDHISGVVSLIDRFYVRHIWVTPFFDRIPEGALLKSLIMEKSPGTEWHYATEGTMLMQNKGYCVTVLAPALNGAGQVKDNDLSMVLKVILDGKSILLAGDAEIAELSYLIRKEAELKSDILLVPHHGGETSFSPQFIDAVSPETAIISTSNSFIFKKVLDYYEGKGIGLRVTANEGAVEIQVAGGQLRSSE